MASEGLEYELNLLRSLVEIDTSVTSQSRGGYEECSELIRLEAQRLGLGTEVLDGRSVTVDGEPRPNVVVSLDGTTDVDLLLVTHMDVVPAEASQWQTPPFKLTLTKDRAYGRGAADDKSNIVAALSAMGELAKHEPEVNMKLLVTCDEEVGGRAGIEYLFDDLRMRGTAGVVVDSAPNYISIGASGALWGRFVVKGVGGHSGYPEKSDNAIYRATRLIEKLKDYHKVVARIRSRLRAPPDAPYPRVHGRFTVTMIKAWEKENVIPGECEIRFDRRLIPEENPKEAQKALWAHINDLAKAQKTSISGLQLVSSTLGYYTEATHPFVRHFSSVAQKTIGHPLPLAADLGGNDGALLSRARIPVVSFGTLRDDTHYHAQNEFVHLKDIGVVRDVIIQLGNSPAAMFSSK
jgi:acetylornithine deacetylase/succinyl-diaminopimelate desuccinylase-like protein